jgi:hypothetical protein
MNPKRKREYALTHSRERYISRKKKFKGIKGKIHHHILWILHNCFVHFILGIRVSSKTIKIHDFTSILLNNPPANRKELCKYFIKSITSSHSPSSYFPDLTYKFRWFLHNSIVHFFLGLFPCKFMFKLHDESARYMDEPDWV